MSESQYVPFPWNKRFFLKKPLGNYFYTQYVTLKADWFHLRVEESIKFY